MEVLFVGFTQGINFNLRQQAGPQGCYDVRRNFNAAELDSDQRTSLAHSSMLCTYWRGVSDSDYSFLLCVICNILLKNYGTLQGWFHLAVILETHGGVHYLTFCMPCLIWKLSLSVASLLPINHLSGPCLPITQKQKSHRKFEFDTQVHCNK